MQSMKRHHVAKFQNDVELFTLKRTTWKRRRDILASENGLQLIEVITPALINHFFGMELFSLIPVSHYNKSLNTQSVRKQELPKHQPLQNPT